MQFPRLLSLLPIMSCLAFQASQPASARDFASIDVPGAVGTFARAINSSGDIVGMYLDSAFNERGFLLHAGAFTLLDFPGAERTEANGINSNGDVVGSYLPAGGNDFHGFLFRNGTFTSIDVPGSSFTFANGINDQGDIVGNYSGGGFLLHAGIFTDINSPFPGDGPNGLAATFPRAIGPQGDIVGYYIPHQTGTGFLLSGGVWTSISVPGQSQTRLSGINSQGDIVGSNFDDIGFNSRGFLMLGGLRSGVVTMLDFPGIIPNGSSNGTQVSGINDRGDIVGHYVSSTPPIRTHGFVSLNSQAVSIVIKPGEGLASINMKSRGTIAIAILSTASFDATSAVDRGSLSFGHSGDEQSISFCSAGGGEINGDGLQDLVCHFTTGLTGFESGDSVGLLKGKTTDGTPIQGNTSVRILR